MRIVVFEVCIVSGERGMGCGESYGRGKIWYRDGK